MFAAYAKGGRRLHVGLQEFGEDVSAAMSAGAAKASNALFSGISSLKLGASFVANAVTIKRVDPRETEGKALVLIPSKLLTPKILVFRPRSGLRSQSCFVLSPALQCYYPHHRQSSHLLATPFQKATQGIATQGTATQAVPNVANDLHREAALGQTRR